MVFTFSSSALSLSFFTFWHRLEKFLIIPTEPPTIRYRGIRHSAGQSLKYRLPARRTKRFFSQLKQKRCQCRYSNKASLSSIHCDVVILAETDRPFYCSHEWTSELNLLFFITRWSRQLYLPITIMDTGTASIIPKQIVHPTFKWKQDRHSIKQY